MPEDRWSSLSKMDVSDEEARLSAIRFDPTDPYAVAVLFLQCLEDHHQYLNALENLITPESRNAWGDFSEAAAILASIEDYAVGSKPEPAFGDPHVCYANVLRGVTTSFEVIEEQLIMAAAAITLVWRPELLGMWRVHAFGAGTVPPDLVPHSPRER